MKEKDLLSGMGKDAVLLMADTDATQSFVFESSRLPEIRGASQLLSELNEAIGQAVVDVGGRKIFAAGGSLIGLLDGVERAANLAQEIERTYATTTGVATISAVARQIPPDYQNRFGQYFRWGSYSLRAHKESKAAPPFVECLPHQARCHSCQKRPADAHASANHPEDEYVICHVCERKRQRGTGSHRQDWFQAFKQWVKQSQYAQQWQTEDNLSYPYSVQEIARATAGERTLVGFVYLDGDRIGQLLSAINAIDTFEEASDRLAHVAKSAVFSALAQLLVPATVEPADIRPHANDLLTIYPFEIITIGGDDIMLVVPAHVAVPLAALVGEYFGREMTAWTKANIGREEPVTMSGGVLITDDHTPVQVMVNVAEQLKQQAKRVHGAVDFHIMYSADMLDRDLVALREQYPYTFYDGKRQLRLLGRPYTHAALLQLWQDMAAMDAANFKNTQLNLLADALLRGRRESSLFYQYQLHRHDDKPFAALGNALRQVQPEGADHPLPWQRVRGQTYHYQTALWDIAELFKFVDQKTAATLTTATKGKS